MNYFISTQTVFFDKHENKNKIKTFKILVSGVLRDVVTPLELDGDIIIISKIAI